MFDDDVICTSMTIYNINNVDFKLIVCNQLYLRHTTTTTCTQKKSNWLDKNIKNAHRFIFKQQ